MSLKNIIQDLLGLTGYMLTKKAAPPSFYDRDGLRTEHNHDFMTDPAFRKAYERGVRATENDYRWEWRVHVGLWAAYSASLLEGDFVECGVNRGFLSSAIMDYLNWDALGKTFYLLDTFKGLDEDQVSHEERENKKLEYNEGRIRSGFYTTNADLVKKNFSEWKNAKIIVGSVPATLAEVSAKSVAYLHLDMNCAPPEVAALEYFWDRLAPGAIILFDDYTQKDFVLQKEALDAVTATKNVKILSLPTGQGLCLKPAAGSR